jgi:hypothetical protein
VHFPQIATSGVNIWAHTYLKFVNVFTVEIAKSKWKNKCYAYLHFKRSLFHKSGSGALPPNSYKWS